MYRRKKRITATALISIADVIMLLLIFILVSSSFITNSGIKINLPESTSNEADYSNNIVLTITKQKQVFLGNTPVELERLPTLLSQMLLVNPSQTVIVYADEELSIKSMVSVLDLAKSSGHNRFFLATRYSEDNL